jgi:hypothetical protein
MRPCTAAESKKAEIVHTRLRNASWQCGGLSSEEGLIQARLAQSERQRENSMGEPTGLIVLPRHCTCK